jgi:uncharacterized membrane protein
MCGMEALVFLLALAFLGLPIAALALALIAQARTARLMEQLERLRREVETLDRRLRAQPSAAPPGPAGMATEAVPRLVPPPPPAAPPPAEPPLPRPAQAETPHAATPGPEPLASLAQPAAAKPAEDRPGIEQRIATQLPVWIGSIALFLAGTYLVKWSFDRGLLGPAARVTIGILFGVALLVLGEWLRAGSRRIAEGLSAAGIADLYASLLAGVSLYHLISKPIGFGLLALTTATAVFLSLRHGALIAVLGLAGGFLTPALIGAREPSAAALFTYLFLLQAGLLAVSRPRRWWPIAAATLGAGAIWAGIWIGFFLRPGDSLPVGMFLLATSGLFAAAALWRGGQSWGRPDVRRGLVLGSMGAPLALLCWLASAGGYSPLEWCFLGLLAAGCVLAARLDEAYEELPWLASAAGLALLVLWWTHGPRPVPVALGWTALGYGGLVSAAAYAAMWGSRAPARWAALSGGTAAAYFVVAWGALRVPVNDPIPWSLVSMALAAAFVAGAWPVARRREGSEPLIRALAALATAATFFVSAAVPLRFERHTWSVAWALEVAALAWLEGKLRVKELHWLARILGVLVVARLLLVPSSFEGPFGSLPVFNWILYAWGIPLAAFLVAAWLYRREGSGEVAEPFEGGAILLALTLLLLEVRHFFHPDSYEAGRFVSSLAGPTQVAEWGLIVGLWLLLAWGLLEIGERIPGRATEWGGPAVTVLALAVGIAGPGFIDNPLGSPLEVGDTPVFNALLVGYGLPAVLMICLSRSLQRRGQPVVARCSAVGSLVFWLLLIATEIRQGFHGRVLSGGPPSGAELYAYSAAFIVFGLLLLVLGIYRRGPVLRWGSLAVMLLAVFKVFLWDLAALRDLYRVFSLLGLGASLLLLAWLYQRFVFGKSE